MEIAILIIFFKIALLVKNSPNKTIDSKLEYIYIRYLISKSTSNILIHILLFAPTILIILNYIILNINTTLVNTLILLYFLYQEYKIFIIVKKIKSKDIMEVEQYTLKYIKKLYKLEEKDTESPLFLAIKDIYYSNSWFVIWKREIFLLIMSIIVFNNNFIFL